MCESPEESLVVEDTCISVTVKCKRRTRNTSSAHTNAPTADGYQMFGTGTYEHCLRAHVRTRSKDQLKPETLLVQETGNRWRLGEKPSAIVSLYSMVYL